MTAKRKKFGFAGKDTKRKGRSKAVERDPGARFALMSPDARALTIRCIIDAAGKKPDCEALLASDIEEADNQFAIVSLLDPIKALRQQTLARSLRNLLEKCLPLIEHNPLIKQAADEAIPGAQLIAGLRQLLASLGEMENSRARQAKEYRSKVHLPAGLNRRRAPALEWLAGVSLPLIYERRFNAPISREKSTEGGISIL